MEADNKRGTADSKRTLSSRFMMMMMHSGECDAKCRIR